MNVQLSPERRSGPRFNVTAPVLIRWSDRTDEGVQVGYCKNVSLFGVLVVASSCPSLGWATEVELVLPGGPERRNVRVLCRGTVVRVEDRNPNSELHVFAVAGEVKEYLPLSRDQSPRWLSAEETMSIGCPCSYELGNPEAAVKRGIELSQAKTVVVI